MNQLTQHYLHLQFQTPSPESIFATLVVSAVWKNLQIHGPWLNCCQSYKTFQNQYTSTELKPDACTRDTVALLPKNLQKQLKDAYKLCWLFHSRIWTVIRGYTHKENIFNRKHTKHNSMQVPSGCDCECEDDGYVGSSLRRVEQNWEERLRWWVQELKLNLTSSSKQSPSFTGNEHPSPFSPETLLFLSIFRSILSLLLYYIDDYGLNFMELFYYFSYQVYLLHCFWKGGKHFKLHVNLFWISQFRSILYMYNFINKYNILIHP